MIGILVATVIRMFVGWFWYHPSVFGREWMRLQKLNEKELGSPAPAMAGAIGTAFVTAYVLSIFVHAMPPLSWHQGAFVGFLAWLGFVATSSLGSVLFAKTSFKLWLLNNGDNLLSYLFMGSAIASL